MLRYISKLLLLVSVIFAEKVRYDGYQIVRVTPETEQQLLWLRRYELNPTKDVELWKDVRGVGVSVDVQLAPEAAQQFITTAQEAGMSVQVTFSDLQKEIDKQTSEHAERVAERIGKEDFPLDVYHTLEEIYERLEYFAATYPDDVTMSKIGETVEGRDIYVMYVGSGDKEIIALDFTIHAREWITPAVGMYILTDLLEGTDPELTQLKERYDWLIINVLNPDGYHYSWETDRMWRKNRHVAVPSSGCVGIDLNRNSDINFGGEGSSSNPCSDIYHGPSPFSEEEMQAEIGYLSSTIFRGRIVSFYSVHSYSQLWMSPYSYTPELPPEYDEQMRVAAIAVDALTATNGTEYEYGNTNSIIYASSGGNRDWVYTWLDVVYTYGLELRDTGEYGFLLPEEQILPCSIETWNGIKAASLAIPQE